MSEDAVFPGCRGCLTDAIEAVLPEQLHAMPDGQSTAAVIVKAYADMYAHANLHMAKESLTET